MTLLDGTTGPGVEACKFNGNLIDEYVYNVVQPTRITTVMQISASRLLCANLTPLLFCTAREDAWPPPTRPL